MTTHQLNRLDHRGHGPVAVWEPDDKVQILKAEEVFKQHQLEGYKMYDISDPSTPGNELKVFDPAVTETLAVPHHKMEGG